MQPGPKPEAKAGSDLIEEEPSVPLRDHFRPPLDKKRSWDGLHGQWPAMIVLELAKHLPRRYAAAPNIHLGSSIEIDVATFEEEIPETPSIVEENHGGGPGMAAWAAPDPTSILAIDFPDLDEYEVRVFDSYRDSRLVAAVEIVSPSNKDRPEHRRAFVAKCARLIQEYVSVTIVDLVTTRNANLYLDLLDFLGQPDPSPFQVHPSLYAATCRWGRRSEGVVLKTWAHSLQLGQPLPTLPLWLAEDSAIPLELEASYEETCKVLRIS
jgi:Protein of unknown function (DUF4058)